MIETVPTTLMYLGLFMCRSDDIKWHKFTPLAAVPEHFPSLLRGCDASKAARDFKSGIKFLLCISSKSYALKRPLAWLQSGTKNVLLDSLVSKRIFLVSDWSQWHF